MPSLSEPLGDLSPAEKRAFLARLLRKKGEKPRLFPLSFAQQRLWLLDQLEPGNTAYLIPFAMRVDGPLTARVLPRSKLLLCHRCRSSTLITPSGNGSGYRVRYLRPN